jgi:hypothetical protein
MKHMQRIVPALAIAAVIASAAAPASASDLSDINLFTLAPFGNVAQHGLDFGIGYRVAKIGPVSISPLADVATVSGVSGWHFGAAATVDITRHIDIGIAEVQPAGYGGFTRFQPTAVIGLHI